MKSIFGKGNMAFYIVALIAAFLINDHTTVLKRMYPQRYGDLVRLNAHRYNLDANLIFALIKAESNFNPRAGSLRGAKGLMQVMDETGFWAAKDLKIEDFTIDDLYDPGINMAIGCWYLNWLMEHFEGDRDKVLAAYNAGNNMVRDWIDNTDSWCVDSIPFKETKVFILRVKEFLNMYEKLY